MRAVVGVIALVALAAGGCTDSETAAVIPTSTSATTQTTVASASSASPTTSTEIEAVTTTTAANPTAWRVNRVALQQAPIPTSGGAEASEFGDLSGWLSHILVSDGVVVGIGEANLSFGAWQTDDLVEWNLVSYEDYTLNCPEEIISPIWSAGVTGTGRLVVFARSQRVCGPGPGESAIVLLSDDQGRTWTRGVFGDGEDAYVESIAEAGGTLYAAGNVSASGSRPTAAVWISADDGETWTRAEGASAFPDNSLAGPIAVLPDRVVVLGSASQDTVTWTTTDSGSTWTRTAIDGDWTIEALTVVGSEVVAVVNAWDDETQSRSYLLATSTDGYSFHVTAASPAFGDYVRGVTLLWWNDRLVAPASIVERTDPQYCFQDIASCNLASTVMNVGLPGEWRRVAGTATSDTWQPHETQIIGSQLVALRLQSVDDGEKWQEIWTWDLDANPQTVEVAAPTTTTPPYELHERNDELPVGETKRFVFTYSGCGAEFLEVNGQTWLRTEVAPPDDSWLLRDDLVFGHAGQLLYATITLVSGSRIEARLESGDVVAVYEPTDQPAPTCW